MSELLGVSDSKKNYPKLRARIEIRQHVAPQKLWHWSVIYDNGHVFSVSDSFTDMDQAIADAALNGGLALRRAMTPNTDLNERSRSFSYTCEQVRNK